MRQLRRAPRGLSLIEVLVASSIGAMLVLLASTLLTKPTRMVDELGTQLQERSILDIQNRELVRRFNRSFVMRRGFFRCGDSPLGEILSASSPYNDRAGTDSDGFSLVYSDFSTVVGLGDAASRRLAVAGGSGSIDGDLARVPAGSMVLLTSLSHPDYGGVYRVEESDDATMTVKLSSTSVSFPADLREGGRDNCTIVNSVPFGTFVDNENNRIFGEQARAYRIDVVRVAHYYPVDASAGRRDLWHKTWPVAAPGTAAMSSAQEGELLKSGPVVLGFSAITMEKASWRATGGAGNTNGEFSAFLDIQTTEKRGVATDASGARQANLITKRLRRPLGYSTSTGGQVNFGVITTPTSAERTYPTCAISLAPLNDFIQRDDGQFGRFYRLSGSIADASVIAGISVEMATSGGGSPACWNEGDLLEAPEGMIAPVARARTTIVPLNPSGSSGALEDLICDAAPNSTFTPTLSYFHSALSKIVVVSCSPAETPAAGATAFVYDGSPSACERASGAIRFGRLIESNTSPARPGPTLYVDGASCEWSSAPSLFQTCVPDPTKGELTRVKLRPSNVPGGIPGGSGANKNEIDCT